MTLAQDLAGTVEAEQVHALLLSRAPALLDTDTGESTLLAQTVRGVTNEVLPLAGPDQESDRWALAGWAITLGVAAQLEAALFPEQQGLANDGRAAYLDRRYQAVLAQLRGNLPSDPNGSPVGGALIPRGSFPEAPPCYPDPAERRPSRWRSW